MSVIAIVSIAIIALVALVVASVVAFLLVEHARDVALERRARRARVVARHRAIALGWTDADAYRAGSIAYRAIFGY